MTLPCQFGMIYFTVWHLLSCFKANHTPFEKAVISRSVEVVEVLLTFGAEPNLQDWVCYLIIIASKICRNKTCIFYSNLTYKMKFIMLEFFFKIFTKGNNSYIQERVLKIIYDVFTGRENLAYIHSMMIYKILLTWLDLIKHSTSLFIPLSSSSHLIVDWDCIDLLVLYMYMYLATRP